ncbi:hypothetical protein C7M84_019925 [Penaeus vannamei]|uniref:Uncharacterized protein n=1 Tax=Penaeus vannamei TaxID=6689 RepID=A0A423SDB9_PENVA|nr:hypothetical protein C7M84_019925 [Penaeus vannamei]
MEMAKEREKLEQEIKTLGDEDKLDKLEEERREMVRMSTAPGSDPQGLEKENRELKERIRLQRDEHEKEMQKMNRKYTAAGPEREHLEKENREMREDIRSLKAKLAQQQEREMALETERETLELDVRCLRDEMEALKSKHEEQMREMHRKSNANGSDTQDLEKENGDLKENIRSLKEQHKKELEAAKNDVTALQESYKDQIRDMNKRRNHAEKEKQAAMKEMKKLEEECEEIKRNHSGREAVIQRLQVENSQLKQQEQHRAALEATKKAEAERLKEAYGDLQAKLAQQQEREMALETEREKLVLDVRGLQDEMEALKGNHEKQLQEMQRKNDANGAETQEMEKENGDLKEKIRSLQELQAKKTAEVERMNDYINNLKIYYETYSQNMKIDLDQMAKEKQEAVMKMETLQDSYREMQKTYSDSKREIHRLQRENSQLKQQAAFPGIPPQAAGGTATPGFPLAAGQDIRGQQTATNPQSKQQAGGAGPKQRQTTIGPGGIYPNEESPPLHASGAVHHPGLCPAALSGGELSSSPPPPPPTPPPPLPSPACKQSYATRVQLQAQPPPSFLSGDDKANSSSALVNASRKTSLLGARTSRKTTLKAKDFRHRFRAGKRLMLGDESLALHTKGFSQTSAEVWDQWRECPELPFQSLAVVRTGVAARVIQRVTS